MAWQAKLSMVMYFVPAHSFRPTKPKSMVLVIINKLYKVFMYTFGINRVLLVLNIILN